MFKKAIVNVVKLSVVAILRNCFNVGFTGGSCV